MILAYNDADTSFDYYGVATSLRLWCNHLLLPCIAIQFEIVWSTLVVM